MVENWTETTLEELCVPSGLVRGPFGGALKKEIFVSSGYKVYEQRNAIYATTEIGNYYITAEKYRELARFAISDGDFIVSCSGTIGCIYQLPSKSPKGVINQALLKITLDPAKIDTELFLQYFLSEPFQKSIIDDTQGGAMKNLVGMDKFRKALFLIPSNTNEQRAIATALSDTDAYIAALEKLIAKKRAIKQGAIQELLTGKRRLPGFSGEWVKKRLDEIATIIKGNGLSKAKLSPNGKYSCVLYGELFTTYDEVITAVTSRTDYYEGVLSLTGDVLLPGSTTTTGIDLARASALLKSDVLIGGDVNIVRPDTTEIDSLFLAFSITNTKQQEIAIRSKGITIYHLHGKDLHDLPITLPPTTEEQAAIAEVLSDMDAEIDALTAKLNKAKHIKQGMMSELLTGRSRLVEQEATTKTVAVSKIIKLPKPKNIKVAARGHNKAIEDAVILAVVTDLYATDQYPLTPFYAQKFPYLLHRHMEGVAQGYNKLAAGPYNAELKYKTALPIAKKKGYVSTRIASYMGKTYQSTLVGDNIKQAKGYFTRWHGDEPLKWLEQFRHINNRRDELELLTTVDMAMVELCEAGKPISVQTVKAVIQASDEWKAKLKREIFSDANIARAIDWSDELFRVKAQPQ